MTIEQIRAFVTAADAPTFLEASEQLHISQSAMSKQIRSLEQELQVELFDRSRRQAELTAAGVSLYSDAVKLLKAHDTLCSHAATFRHFDEHTIRLGVLPLLPQYGLNPLLRSFTKQYPDYQLIIDEVEDDVLCHGLKNQSYDLVIGRVNTFDGIAVEKKLLARDHLVLLAALDHPLAEASQVALADLKQEAFLFMHPTSSIYHLCVQTCEDYGFTPQIVRTAKIESILSAVAANEGISLLCQRNLDVFQHQNLAVINLNEIISANVVLAWREKKRLSVPERKLIGLLAAQDM